jgi:acyl-CoA thioester hydrolase
MTERWPSLAGRFTEGAHVLPVRVYYEDTDFSGAVYHANYLKFCERGRSDCLRLLGVQHHELHWHASEGRMGFVVRRMVCDFLKPARIDDLLEVETRFREMAGARLELIQNVRRQTEALFTAEVTVALVDDQGRPRRLPKAMVAALSAAVKRPERAGG